MHGRAPRRGSMEDSRHVSYDTRNAVLSVLITAIVAASVFEGFYLFYPRGAQVPTGPAVTQQINHTAPPNAQDESAPTQVPTIP
jgi:hypothetical protein